MLRPRVIPCLLIRDNGLVKTFKFEEGGKYIGDPLNAVRIFNEKEVDELVVLDIDATRERRQPDYALIKRLASECRMPLCYGGGIQTVEHIQKIISLGVEKVSLGNAAVVNPELISRGAEIVGSQSIVSVMDVGRTGWRKKEEVLHLNGSTKSGERPEAFAQKCQDLGAGEILVQSVDRDGTMQGYDLELAKRIRSAVSIPLTFLGGAGDTSDIEELLSAVGTVGAAAGSLFVFKGRLQSVLINYPSRAAKNRIVETQSTYKGLLEETS